MADSPFSADLPEWISPPGDIVAKILEFKQVDLDDFAESIGLSIRQARGVIEGTIRIDRDIAKRLAHVVGSTSSFWLRCERNYREDIRRNLPAYVDNEVKSWLKRLPLGEMSRLGWLDLHRDTIRQAEECFRFFGVTSLNDWKERELNLLSRVNFRTSVTFSADPMATSAWLRWAESQAEDISCQEWNREAFAASLDAVRALSRNHHPEWFVPRLREICAESGVALVIAPAPKGCRASGATKVLRRRKAMIVLSFRYYSDDHFWFSFFHEAGHLVLHMDQGFFLDEENGEIDNREREANEFALQALVPPEKQARMFKLSREYKAYIEFARDIGVAPGVVVGQMQRLGYLPYSWLNKLKRRFDWNDLYERGLIP